jgi:16S rRNA (guanine966-N2)-methyltransferase
MDAGVPRPEGAFAMRIIAGQRRGHKIDGPSGRDVRPTSDFVREAIFNILRDRVEDRTVYDVFAGTGALGLEALSRGASQAIFVEHDRGSVGLIRRNLAVLRYEDRGRIVPIDAYRWGRTFQPSGSEPVVVFIDPPYREFQKRPERARDLLGHLASRLPEASILVVESGQPLGADILPDPELWDQRKYGGTHVALLTVGEAPAMDEDASDDDYPNDEPPHDDDADVDPTV